MRSASRLAYLAVAAAILVALAIYAARITHDFYTHVDRAVYAAVDDGEANIAYELASHGRYAFPASPVLEGLSRMRGQFNYGPWYFYLAGGLIWLFGYSLTLVRSIHLFVVLIAVAAGIGWFRGRGGVAAAGLFGFGFLFFFETAQWPMVRPDSLVTLCAVVMTIAAGRGLSRGRPGAWFVTGLAASCGAFTHLIAASLLVSSVVLFGVFAWQARRRDGASLAALRPAAFALAGGVLLGALMFYASFRFDFIEQWRFLTGYRALSATGETFVVALQRHFHMAFGFLSSGMQRAVLLTLGIAWVSIAAALVSAHDRWRRVLAYVLPPALIWSLYFLSNGKYTNYHSGYAILHQAMFLWTAAALVFVACGDGAGRATLGLLPMLLALAVLGQGVRQLRWQQALPAREAQAAHRVGFSEYVDRVIGTLPRRAVVWGSVLFGIESPDRLQLVQPDDAATLAESVPLAHRAAFVPDFVIWGYPESREDVLSTSDSETRVVSVYRMFPDAHFRLASLVEGAPYGVTRVYARVSGPDAAHDTPSAAGYDDVHRRWVDRIGPKLPAAFVAVDPVVLKIGNQAEPPPRVPYATLAGDLPPGRYLLTVSVKPTEGRRKRLIAVTSSTMLRQTSTELGMMPEGDFAPYAQDDREVFAISAHPGGRLYVSQFDGNAGAGITSVSVSPILDLLSSAEHEVVGQPLPIFTRWIPMPGVQGMIKEGRLHVDGDASPASYQLYSPLIAAAPGDTVEADVPSAITNGRVCAGILNGRGQWLVAATRWRQQFDFVADATGGFRVAFTNCQLPGETQATRLDVLPGSYVTAPPPSYSDRLVGAALEGAPVDSGRRPVTPIAFPEQPVVSIAPADVILKAAGVTRHAGGWSIAARADAASPILLKARVRYVDNETHLVVAGRIERGGLVVGLLRGDEWAIKRTINEPGDFVALLTPKDTGQYAVAVAADSTSGAEAAATLTRIDLVPPMRPAK